MDGNGPKFFQSIYPRIAVVGACTLVCAALVTAAQREMEMIAIDRMDLGKPPAEFDFAVTGQGKPGQWVVVSDPTAIGGRAIEQTSTDRTDYRFPLAIHRAVSARNIEVNLRFKPVEGDVDQAGGIALRVIDADNYYVVRGNALEDNVRFYRVIQGRREQIAGANIKVSASEWHTLSLRADDDRFTVTFDGKQLYTATDRTFAAAGKVALWTKADSVTRFERIEILRLP